jgi:hypothetical protein
MRRKTKEGTARRNKYGEIMFVERYNTKNNVWVRFRNNYRVCTTWWRFSTGNVKSPYDKNIYGIGYFGFGKYKPYINGKKTNCYNTWHSIFTRCYSQKVHEKYPTYKDCQVCEEWLNFQNFSEWYDRNYYEIDGEKMCLDKDILVKEIKFILQKHAYLYRKE